MQSPRRTEPIGWYALRAAELRRQQSAHRHIEGFHNLVKYLVRLRRDGTLDNDDFTELVKRAAAVFIEAEVTDKVERVLEDKIPLDYLLRL